MVQNRVLDKWRNNARYMILNGEKCLNDSLLFPNCKYILQCGLLISSLYDLFI